MTRPADALSHLKALFPQASIQALAPPVRHEPSGAELRRVREILRRILTENVIPFWYPGVIDERHGGYRLNHDPQGRWRGHVNKHIILQTRVLWFFSRLARTEYGTSEHLAAARHGYEFLRQRMLDEQFGGMYWEVNPTGSRATEPRKHALSQAYGIYAFGEYARASGDSAALALARQLFDLLEGHVYDPEFGGYREWSERDWSPVGVGARGGGSRGRSLKLYTTHIHLMEALTTYYALAPDSAVYARLVELITINSNTVVRKGVGACTDRHERDWTPLRGAANDRVTYGHDLENLWLLSQACTAARLPNTPLLDLYRTLFDYALAYGFDQEAGGFYESGPLEEPADQRDKVWWVQAETLLAALQMYCLTGEKPYFTCFTRTLSWIEARQVDWQHGEWHARVLESGETQGDKAGAAWKGPYHNGRGLIESLELLPAPAEP